jgi:hypothetical protein
MIWQQSSKGEWYSQGGRANKIRKTGLVLT